jgi:hypothetical protein
MPLVARLLLAWFTVSALVSPLIGMVLASGRRDTTPAPALPTPQPVPA